MLFAKNMRLSQRLRWFSIGSLGSLALIGSLSSCSSKSPQALSATQSSEYGTLAFMANGEDLVRQGLLSKDEWTVTFDHLYVTLDQVSAHSSSQIEASTPEKSAQADDLPDVTLPNPTTIDLAAGDETAEPILIASAVALPGQYRGLSFNLTPAQSGPAQGSSLMLQGQAQKGEETIQFALRLNPALSFRCGDYVGEERKGIVKAQQTADIEATFHLDHLFGDGNQAADETMNLEALGFDPIAQLAENGVVDLDMPTLLSQLSATDADTLQAIFPHLGHVGEGHCEAEQV